MNRRSVTMSVEDVGMLLGGWALYEALSNY